MKQAIWVCIQQSVRINFIIKFAEIWSSGCSWNLVFQWSGSKPPRHTPIEKLWLPLPTDPDGSNPFQRWPCHTKVWNPWHDQGLFLSMLMSKFDHVRDSYGSWLRWLEAFDEFLWSATAANSGGSKSRCLQCHTAATRTFYFNNFLVDSMG